MLHTEEKSDYKYNSFLIHHTLPSLDQKEISGTLQVIHNNCLHSKIAYRFKTQRGNGSIILSLTYHGGTYNRKMHISGGCPLHSDELIQI